MEREPVSCGRFEEMLFELLEGCLPTAGRDALYEHARDCPSCRELRALADDAATPRLAPAGDLTSSVLAATSGAACPRAEGLLGERLEGPLASLSTELLAMHLESCPPCAALNRALQQLPFDLPMLAELGPGPDFVSAVVAATSGRPGRRRVADRLRRRARRLLDRPRLALEFAYVGTLAVALVVGWPLAPAGPEARATSSPVPERPALQRIQSITQQAWTASAEGYQSSLRQANALVQDGLRGLGEGTSRTRRLGAELCDQLVQEQLPALMDRARDALTEIPLPELKLPGFQNSDQETTEIPKEGP